MALLGNSDTCTNLIKSLTCPPLLVDRSMGETKSVDDHIFHLKYKKTHLLLTTSN